MKLFYSNSLSNIVCPLIFILILISAIIFIATGSVNGTENNSSTTTDNLSLSITEKEDRSIISHRINATSEQGGKIHPSGITGIDEHGTQTFSIYPDNKFFISDVLVDGISVGPVNSYTFQDVTENRSIFAIFNVSNRSNQIYKTEQSDILKGQKISPQSDKQNNTLSMNPILSADKTSGKVKNNNQIHVLFAVNTTSGNAPLAVQFTDASLGNPIFFYWEFGDGGSSSDKNPVHLYQAPGIYTVTLRATSYLDGGVGIWTDGISVQ